LEIGEDRTSAQKRVGRGAIFESSKISMEWLLLICDPCRAKVIKVQTNPRGLERKDSMSDEEKNDQIIQEEDEHGNLLVYPVWSKKNAPEDRQDKWEVPIYI